MRPANPFLKFLHDPESLECGRLKSDRDFFLSSTLRLKPSGLRGIAVPGPCGGHPAMCTILPKIKANCIGPCWILCWILRSTERMEGILHPIGGIADLDFATKHAWNI